MPHKIRDVVKSLLKKGFVETEGSRHRKFTFKVGEDKSPVFTVISHGDTELRDTLTGIVARQLHLNSRQFDELVQCPLSRDEYTSLLRQKGVIESPSDQE